MSTHNVHPIFARILDTMNGTHELSAEQRAELANPMHADVRRQLETPPAPSPHDTLMAGILSDIDKVCSIYRTVGDAMYDEPRIRLAGMIAARVLGEANRE